MDRKSLIFFLLFSFIYVNADNNDMVVLIHGWTGSSESFEYPDQLQAVGLDYVAVNINSFAGDHDRACETYAQIMGTRVDYGVCHSRETGQQRFGEDFSGRGLYPQWSAENHIHIMGHSQGGITARFLQDLMEVGSDCDEDTSPLLTGGKSWITSISTWATPHSLVGYWDRVAPMAQDSLLRLYAREGFGFPQFGLVQQEGETFDNFLERIEATGFFESNNFAFNNLKTKSKEEFNSKYPTTFENTYYFAFACERTNPREICNMMNCNTVEVPDPAMSPGLKLTASVIGSSGPQEDRANDGLVSQRDARCPAKARPCTKVEDGDLDTWTPSVWHYVDIGYLDHNQIVGRDDFNDATNYAQSAKKLWLEHAIRVKGLPSNSGATQRVDIFERKEMAAAARRVVEARRFLSGSIAIEASSTSGAAIFGLVVAVLAAIFGVALLVKKGKKHFTDKEATGIEQHYTQYL